MPITTDPAAAPGLPEPNRRGFLRGLTSLPLIGGSVALIGAPSAVAEPVTLLLMRRYATWLAQEHGRAHDAYLDMLAPEDRRWGSAPYFGRIEPIAGLMSSYWPEDPIGLAHAKSGHPSHRAALVLSAVGCDRREGVR